MVVESLMLHKTNGEIISHPVPMWDGELMPVPDAIILNGIKYLRRTPVDFYEGHNL